MSAKAKLVADRGKVDQPEKDAQDKLSEYVKEQLPGLARAICKPSPEYGKTGYQATASQREPVRRIDQ